MSKQNGNKGRRFDRAFKEEAVRLLQTSGRRQRQIAGDLGISVSALGRWVTELSAEDLLSGPHEDAAKEITCAAWRPDTVGYRDPVVATKLSLKSLARRILDINDEIAELDRFIVPLVEELAPSLLELEGVGTENAGAVMVAVGDNPDRLRSEASFAMMCGVCPIPASSGKTQRHRLNRGGNRQANSALHMVVVCRMRTDERTRAYVARRTLEGLSKREIMRCLKRYVAREIYRVLTAPSSA